MKRWTVTLLALLALLACLLPLTAQAADLGFTFVSTNSNTTNCQVVASGEHWLSGMTMGNTGAAAWLKFYDMTTTPTAGGVQGATPAGAPYPFPVPGATALAGTNTFPSFPLHFTLGLAFCATGGAANADATALATSQVAGTIFYH